MPIVTLLTDFGLKDEYVGVMKGVILSICPAASIVDISHQIEPHDLLGAAFCAVSYPRYFPPETVHVMVVDPGVGTKRAIIALSANNQIFVAPDNGILSLLLEKYPADLLIRVEEPKYCLPSISSTFQGRDVFAPVAAHLANGIDLNKLGPQLPIEKIVNLKMNKTVISKHNELTGRIVAIDRFGNLISDIEAGMLEQFYSTKDRTKVVVWIGRRRINGITNSYADVGLQEPVAVVGSRGYLEIAVNQGSAHKYFHAGPGDAVSLKLAG